MAGRADRLQFLAARGALVIARPATLVIASRLLGKDAANEFAQAIVAVGFGLIASAFDSGRLYYEAALDAEGTRAVAFHRYLGRAWIAGAVGAIATGAILWKSGSAPAVIAAATAYFATERITDERQRYLLVDRRTREWSRMQLWRGALQVALAAATLAALGWAGGGSVSWLLLALAAANIATMPALRALRFGTRAARSPGAIARLSARGARTIGTNWALWASGLMAATIGYGDRLAVALWDGPDTASLVVTCSCLSLQSVVVATFFFTPRRAAIVRREVPMSAFASRAYILPAAAGLAAGAAFATASLAGFAADARAPLAAIGAAAAASVATTFAGIVREVCFYRASGSRLAVVDGCALAAAAAASFGAWAAGLPVSVAFLSLAAVQAARAAALAAAARHRGAAGPRP